MLALALSKIRIQERPLLVPLYKWSLYKHERYEERLEGCHYSSYE